MPILTRTDGTKFAYAFQGVDPMCGEGLGASAQSCAIHIHNSTSCDAPPGELLAGEGVDNPWLDVHYTATPDGRAMGLVSIVTGLCIEDVIGHVLGIHDHAGNRIACSIITPMPEVAHATGFVKYVGYEGKLTTAAGGAYPITSDGEYTKFTYDIIGADPMCQDGPREGVELSCGLHLHEGTSCEEEAGDLYYEGKINPWPDVGYTTLGGEECTADSVVSDPSSCYLTGELESVKTHLRLEEVTGKVLILHDHEGTPYACATVEHDIGRAPLRASGWVPYHTYDPTAPGALNVSGTVSPMISQAIGATNSSVKLKGMPAQSFAYNLTGVDPACADGPTAEPNSCGIHVHEATSCDTDGRDHFYAPAAGTDPWLHVVR